MKALVVYGSRYGNTQHIAEAIADGLKDVFTVDVCALDKATPAQVQAADLVVVGGPTEAHSATPPVKVWIDGMAFALDGKPAAAFDTRLDFARVLSGSAAKGIEAHMRRAGARMVIDGASFLVKGKQPLLEPGELARAVAWGREIGAKVDAPVAALAK